MKSGILPLFALMFILLSCNDEEATPTAKIRGQYQSSAEITRDVGLTPYIFVNSLEFKADGKVYGEGKTFDGDTEELLGHRYYFNGTYAVIDGKVSVNYQETYGMYVTEIYYMDIEDLTEYENSVTLEYSIQEDYTQLHHICSTFPDCETLESYEKVE